uniref:Tyrosine-protein kinase n=1 Tax=Caenorhabditis tropicalis TaxID=1561998 RepID=A0A1I7TQ91_9PELO
MDTSTKAISLKPAEPREPVIREKLPGGDVPLVPVVPVVPPATQPGQGGSKESPNPPVLATPPQDGPKPPQEAPKPTPDVPKPVAIEAPTIQMPLEMKTCKFYHGIIPRVDAEQSLRNVGDYLLRRTEPNEVTKGLYIVITVKKETGYVHVPLSQTRDALKQFYFVPAVKENTILEVIDQHHARAQPIAAGDVLLRKPVFRSTWIIDHEDVILYRKIGSGAFGEVFLARMVDPTSEYVLDCAVKKLKQEATLDAKLRFMKEARMMKKNYKHKHLVMIFGIATLNSPLLILMELCPNGSLISHLRKNKGKVTVLDKLRFTAESSSGLAYLEKMDCIHRDVAARNCLLSAKNEIKISDFGLADDKGMIIDHSLDKLPIKWLAPETMQDKVYSLKSDIWAFGIMIWEIFADGEEPYPGLNNLQARAKIVALDYRMKFPDETPTEVVQVIATCWLKNPDQRSTMLAHSQALQQIYEAKMPLLLANQQAPGSTPTPGAVAPGAATPPEPSSPAVPRVSPPPSEPPAAAVNKSTYQKD